MILDKKHEMQRKLFRQFAETEFTKEIQDELDETGEFNWDMHKKMARYGFMGVKIPKEYGGAGADSLTYALMVEELARVDAVLSIYANTSNSLGGGPLLLGGNEAQKQKYLPAVASGEKIMVFGLTEPVRAPMPAAPPPPPSPTGTTSSSTAASASSPALPWPTGPWCSPRPT